MAEESAKLRIPYIAAAQAQKHVTHNEAMTLLDTLVQLSVLDKDLTAPPGDPEEGDCYIVAGGGGSATGAWIGWEQRVARFIDGEWRSYLPGQGNGAGWLAWVLDEDAMYRFDGEDWTLAGIEGPQGPQGDPGEPGEPGATGPTGPAGASSLTIVRAVAGSDVDISSELEDGDAIDGVTLVAGDRVLLAGQTAPEENGVYLVSASGPATRDGDFGAYDDHPGVYFSVMEGSAYADTLWRCTSNRGGTIDSDGLVFTEFSAGGVTSVNGQTGDVVLRERLAANRTYYVNASSGSDSNDGLTSGAAFATIGKAIDVAYTLDWGIFRVTVQLADGTYALNKTIVGPFLSSQRLLILGNTGTPSNVTITSTGNGFRTQNGAAVEFSGVTFSPSGFCAHNPSAGGDIKIGANCRFTNSPTFAHVYVVSGGYAEMLHPFEVAASCNAVMRCDFGGIIEGRTGAQTITISNTPVWTEGFAAAHYGGIISFAGKSFSGSATGPRFACSHGGIIFTNGGGASYFPGNASGTGTNLGTSPYGAYL